MHYKFASIPKVAYFEGIPKASEGKMSYRHAKETQIICWGRQRHMVEMGRLIDVYEFHMQERRYNYWNEF